MNKTVTILPTDKKNLKPQQKIMRPRKRRVGTLSQSQRKFLESKYSSGPAAYGSVKNLQKSLKFKLRKRKAFLENKNAHTKHKKFRKTFHRLKIISYTINEIWSLDLAHVDKLALYNRDIEYILVAVDCLSRYLQFEPLKSKYATSTAEAFKQMIKHKKPQKVWVDAGTEFKGSFKTLCEKMQIHIYNFLAKKVGFCERKYSFCEKLDLQIFGG